MVGWSLYPSGFFHRCVTLGEDEVDAGGRLQLAGDHVVPEEGVPAVVVRVEAELLELRVLLVLGQLQIMVEVSAYDQLDSGFSLPDPFNGLQELLEGSFSSMRSGIVVYVLQVTPLLAINIRREKIIAGILFVF